MWYSCRGALAEHCKHPMPPPTCGLGGGFCSGANRTLKPAPAKTKTIMQSTISCQPLMPRSRGSCPACRKLARVRETYTKNPNRSDNWPVGIAMSIPFSESQDCHEDRGPNQLDPCDSLGRGVRGRGYCGEGVGGSGVAG